MNSKKKRLEMTTEYIYKARESLLKIKKQINALYKTHFMKIYLKLMR